MIRLGRTNDLTLSGVMGEVIESGTLGIYRSSGLVPSSLSWKLKIVV